MSIEIELKDVIQENIKEIKRCPYGTEEYEKQIRGTTQLIDRFNEMERIELDKQKAEIELNKLEVEAAKNKDEKKDHSVKNVLTAIGLGITALGTVAMFIFEERGSITTQVGRKILDRVYKTK